MSVVDILAAVPLFTDLDKLELAALAGIMGVHELTKDQPLMIEGQPATGLYVILSGKVAVKKARDAEGDHICDLDAGECVGEIEVLDGSPCSASVVCYGDVEVAGVEQAGFDAFLAARPQTAVKILRRMVAILAMRLRQSNVSYSSLKAIAEISDD